MPCASVPPVGTRSLGAGDHAQSPFAVLIADHAGQKAASNLAAAGTKLLEHAPDAHRLQSGKLERQRFAGRADIKQPLAPVGALLLHLAPEGELALDWEDEITRGACVTRPEEKA